MSVTPTPSVDDLLAARYGAAHSLVVSGTPTIEQQLAHRSVRKFTDEDVSEEQLASIVAAASSASSSSNQLWWSIIAVREPATKDQIRRLAGGQDFIVEAPLFLVWVADLSRAATIADEHNAPTGGLPFLETTITAVIDTALASQNAAVAAESLGLGITYVGGVRNHPIEMATLLGVPPRAFAVFGMAIGHPDPSEEAGVRPRLTQSVVLHREKYRQVPVGELSEFDDELRSYFAQFGGDRGWFEAVLRRIAGPEAMSGRHLMREYLSDLGLPSH